MEAMLNDSVLLIKMKGKQLRHLYSARDNKYKAGRKVN